MKRVFFVLVTLIVIFLCLGARNPKKEYEWTTTIDYGDVRTKEAFPLEIKSITVVEQNSPKGVEIELYNKSNKNVVLLLTDFRFMHGGQSDTVYMHRPVNSLEALERAKLFPQDSFKETLYPDKQKKRRVSLNVLNADPYNHNEITSPFSVVLRWQLEGEQKTHSVTISCEGTLKN